MSRRVIGRDGDRVLVDLGRGDPALGAVLLDNRTVSPALPVVAFLEAGLYDQPVDDPEQVLELVGNPPNGLP